MELSKLFISSCSLILLYGSALAKQNNTKLQGQAPKLYKTAGLEKLNKQLKKVDKIELAELPTPLIALTNLSRHLSGPMIYLKSDNLSGNGGGGNKLRKLSYVMAEALKQGATDIITTGATQSNHCRMTASQCARLGLECHLILENRRANYEARHMQSGNIFLDKLFGAKIYHFKKGTDTKNEMSKLAKSLEKNGRKPYIISGGASNSLGALGYVEAAAELVVQLETKNIKATHIVTATGSAGTQAGLAVGLQALGSPINLLGFSTRYPQVKQEEKVFKLTQEIGDRLNIPRSMLTREFIKVNANFVGKGYGEPGLDCIEAIKMVAQKEGVLLDPVYSGKAMAGLIAMIKNGTFRKDDTVVFIHTGGEDSLSAYEDSLLLN